MSGGVGLGKSKDRRPRGTLTVLLNCIFCLGFGWGQGIALGEGQTFDVSAPLKLILSTDLELSEEFGGSQGIDSEQVPDGEVKRVDTPIPLSDPTPGVSLTKATLPAVSAFEASPSIVNSDKPNNQIAAMTQSTGGNITVLAGRVQTLGELRVTDQAGRIRTVYSGDAINEGDTLDTGKVLSTQITMEDGGELTLRPGTRIKIDKFSFNGKIDGTERSFYSLYQGGFRSITGLIGKANKQSYRVTTPSGNIGIHGTDHEVVYIPEDSSSAVAGVYNKVNMGGTTLSTNEGAIDIRPGEMGYAGGMDKLPQLQPIVLALFSENTAPDSVASTKDLTVATTVLSEPLAPPSSKTSDQLSQTSGVSPTQVVVNGEAQKNGEVKYTEANKKDRRAEGVGSLQGFKFGLAPILWGGGVSETLRYTTNSSGSSTFQNTQKIEFRAATYIWQPWLARLRGSLGLAKTQDVYKTSTFATSDSSYTSIFGSVALSLLSRSRFPFDATYRVDDNRSLYALSPSVGTVYKSLELRQRYRPVSATSNTLATYTRTVATTQNFNSPLAGDMVNTRWTLRHDYRPRYSKSKYSLGYDRNIWNTADGAGNASWGLQGTFTTSFDKQSLGVDARRSETYYALNGVDLSSRGIVVRHTYRRDALLSVSSSASVDQANMSAVNSYNTRYLQANTYTTWQPDADLPLYVNASARIYDSSFERLGTVFLSQNQVLGLGARYAHTRNLSYALDGSIANSKNDGVVNRTVTENGSVNYSADMVKFGDASYNRNANASINFQSNTTSASNRTLSGGAGHNLAIPYQLKGGAFLDFNVDQSVLARNDRLNGQNRSLTHGGRASWRPVSKGTLSGSVNAGVSDIRSFGGDEQFHYQSASLGVSALNQASANSSLRASASLQWSSNGLGQYSNSANANLEYKHGRAFDVQGLRYELLFNHNESLSRSSNPLFGQSDTSVSSLDQNLDYRIGRANVRLSLGLARYGKATSKSVMLHLGRSFGRL